MQDFRALFVELVEKDTVEASAGTRAESRTLGVRHSAAPQAACGRALAYELSDEPAEAGRQAADAAERGQRAVPVDLEGVDLVPVLPPLT